VPRAPFDALENLSKEAPRQVAFGELQDEVPGMADQAPTGLEQTAAGDSSGTSLIEGGQGKRRVRADDDRLALRAVAVNDGKEDLVPPVRAVDVNRPELGRETIALWAEDKEG
jgi:hypothetical protein